MPRRPLIIILLTVITISLMLPGCGRKGDLYLPDASTSDTSDTSQKKKQQTQ